MNWIEKSVKEAKELNKHMKLNSIDIFIKDKVTNGIDVDFVFGYIAKFIPSHLLSGVDIIYIGHFDIFDERQVNAIYQDGAIYITNHQTSDEDMIDDIVHELSHSVEETQRENIYGDGRLMKEFMGKRKKLFFLMKQMNLNPDISLTTNPSYDDKIDNYFYKEVGYPKMWNIVNGLFPSPYSCTCLREYFAMGFEKYYLGEKKLIKSLCPVLFGKLEYLDSLGEK